MSGAENIRTLQIEKLLTLRTRNVIHYDSDPSSDSILLQKRYTSGQGFDLEWEDMADIPRRSVRLLPRTFAR